MYVGNLPYSVTTDDLREMFSKFGEITDAIVIMDRATNRSKGFGFVEYAKEENTVKARDEMNGNKVDGRSLKVDYAREKREF